MTLSQFSSYAIGDRTRIVMIHGKMLGMRFNSWCYIFLYHLCGFFVEVWYSKADSSRVMVYGFKNAKTLEPYLKEIGLSELV